MIPFIDLKAQYRPIEDKIKSRINTVLEHGQYVMGPEVKELEENLAKYVGVRHAIGCSSGTDALLLALLALDIGPGDEVIVPDFSFFATCEVVSLIGAKPVFVDVDPDTYNMDIEAMKAAINSNTKAIMPVSLYGQCADFDEINEIATANALPVIEDGAQSFGAEYKGKKSCGLTTIGCTSFFPSKPLGGYGDGGALFTNDDELASKIRELLNHGQSGRYLHTRIGINGRIDSLQAAILIEKLEIFPKEIEQRQAVAKRYIEALSGKFKTPTIAEHNLSAWAQFTIEVEDRDKFQEDMKKLNVPTAVHYPGALSAQPVYHGVYDVENEVTNAAASRVVSLPFHPYMSEEDQNKVIEAVLSLAK
jgi:UDP-2-acetamido-2-deoxy-ribo-hexuluronate aminotransferase